MDGTRKGKLLTPLEEVKVVRLTKSFVYVYKQADKKTFVAKIAHGSLGKHASQLIDPPPNTYEPEAEIVNPNLYFGPEDAVPVGGGEVVIHPDPGKGGGSGINDKAFGGGEAGSKQVLKPKEQDMVPVVQWDDQNVWMFVKSTLGPLLVQVPHAQVSKYDGKVVKDAGFSGYAGKLDPGAYKGIGDIYPLDWTADSGVAPAGVLHTYQGALPDFVPAPPKGFKATGELDSNGYPTAVHMKSKNVVSLVPGMGPALLGFDSDAYQSVDMDTGEVNVSSVPQVVPAAAQATLVNADVPAGYTLTKEKDPNGLPIVKDSDGLKWTLVPGQGPMDLANGAYKKMDDQTGELVGSFLLNHGWVSAYNGVPAGWHVNGDTDMNGFPIVTKKQGPSKKKAVFVKGVGLMFLLSKKSKSYTPMSADTWEALPGEYTVKNGWDGPLTAFQQKTVAELQAELQSPSKKTWGYSYPSPTPAAVPSPAPLPVPAKIPEKAILPPLSSLTLVPGAASSLAGAGKKEVYEDPAGNRYLFKVAATKGANVSAPHRAYAQAAFSALARQVRPEHLVIEPVVKSDGTVGTLQPFLDGTSSVPDASDLSESDKIAVATDHMLDWVMSQHDSHKANFIRTKDGVILSLDKEQGFRFIDSDKLSVSYHPNSVEAAPYYNKFWADFRDKKMDFDPKALEPAIAKLVTADMDAVLPSIEKYAEDMWPGPSNAWKRQSFVQTVVSRKLTARVDFEAFITKLYNTRENVRGVFTFKNGWVPDDASYMLPATVDQTTTKTGPDLIKEKLGSSAIKDHNTDPSLVLIRVQSSTPHKVIYDLLASLGVPPVGAAINGSHYNSVIVEKALLNKVVKTTTVAVPNPAILGKGHGVLPHSGVPTYFPAAPALPEKPGNVADLADMEKKRIGPTGYTITLDSEHIEAQTASVQRRMNKLGEVRYHVSFKLRHDSMLAAKTSSSLVSGQYSYQGGVYNEASDAIVDSGAVTGHMSGKMVSNGADQLWLSSESSFSRRSMVWAIVHNEDVAKALKPLLDQLSLSNSILKDPSSEDAQVYKMAQMLWASDPGASATTEVTKSALSKALQKAGVSPEEISACHPVETVPGKQSLIVPNRWRAVTAPVKGDLPLMLFAYWQRDSSTNVARLLKGGAVCINDRYRLGGPVSGASVGADIGTGGADNVTLRIASSGTGSSSLDKGSVQGPVKLIIAPDILDRLDVHLALGDSFGCTDPNESSYGHYFSGRATVREKLLSFAASAPASTELVVRRGVHPTKIIRVIAENESMRQSLIKGCLDVGYTSHVGCPIEDFIVVGPTTQLAVYERYVKPMGY